MSVEGIFYLRQTVFEAQEEHQAVSRKEMPFPKLKE